MPESFKTALTRVEDELSSVLARLATIESRIGGPPLDDEAADDRRLSKRQLALRWSISTRGVDRRRADNSKFPAAVRDYPGGPTYYWLSAIKEYEKQRAARVTHPHPRSTAAAREALKQQRTK